MDDYRFEPQVDEDEWHQTPPKRLWSMWCSMPYRPERNDPDRKRLLVVVALMRAVEDQLTDPRLRATIGVAEASADGLVTRHEVEDALRQAEEAYDAADLPDRAAAAAARLPYEENETAEMLVSAAGSRAALLAGDGDRDAAYAAGRAAQEALTARLIREVHGNPFRPVAFDPAWRTDTAVSLARQMYDARDFAPMPILADALQDTGCDNDDVLAHCRDPQAAHVRGCWVIDLVLGKA